MARAARGKTLALPKTLNLSSGKTSTRTTEFSDTAWGKASRGYAASARKLKKAKFAAVIKGAEVFMKTRVRGKTSATSTTEVIDVDVDEERAGLITISDSDSESCSDSDSE